MARNTMFFVALLASALALGPALAHLLELPNKIDMGRDAYFATQQAYRGWNQLAYLLLVQLASIVAVAVLYRRELGVLWPTLVACACLLLAQAIFWRYTYPANVATRNWTTTPAGWDSLRRQWELSHAAGAVFQMLAMGFLIVAVLARTQRQGGEP